MRIWRGQGGVTPAEGVIGHWLVYGETCGQLGGGVGRPAPRDVGSGSGDPRPRVVVVEVGRPAAQCRGRGRETRARCRGRGRETRAARCRGRGRETRARARPAPGARPRRRGPAPARVVTRGPRTTTERGPSSASFLRPECWRISFANRHIAKLTCFCMQNCAARGSIKPINRLSAFATAFLSRKQLRLPIMLTHDSPLRTLRLRGRDIGDGLRSCLRSDASQEVRDALLVVLDGHVEGGLSVLVHRGQAGTAFHEELHDFERRVSRAGFMQGRVVPIIFYVDLGAVIHQPPCSDDIALVCECMQQSAAPQFFIDIDAGFQTQGRNIVVPFAMSLVMSQSPQYRADTWPPSMRHEKLSYLDVPSTTRTQAKGRVAAIQLRHSRRSLIQQQLRNPNESVGKAWFTFPSSDLHA